jgi:cytosine/adenosine deaminase-related metal-dependent hydrolase
VTTNAAKVMHLEGYGLAAGCDASFVLLQARDPVEAIRLRATRLKVFRKGKLLAQTPAGATRELDDAAAPGLNQSSSKTPAAAAAAAPAVPISVALMGKSPSARLVHTASMPLRSLR